MTATLKFLFVEPTDVYGLVRGYRDRMAGADYDASPSVNYYDKTLYAAGWQLHTALEKRGIPRLNYTCDQLEDYFAKFSDATGNII